MPTLPSTQSTVNEILELIRSTLGVSRKTFEDAYPEVADNQRFPRQYFLNFEDAKVIFIYNIFDICDICLVEFSSIGKSSECYELCNKLFQRADIHLWFDDETLIQFYVNMAGNNSFRFCLQPLRSKELRPQK